jgi:hypothetical protein
MAPATARDRLTEAVSTAARKAATHTHHPQGWWAFLCLGLGFVLENIFIKSIAPAKMGV